MGKTILILNAGKEAIDGIITAKNMGLYVIVCDMDEDAPGIPYADDFIKASIYHPDEVINALKDYPRKDNIDGVITIAADNPLTVAKVATFLNLFSQNENCAKIASNKYLMKELLIELNINTPKGYKICDLNQLKTIVDNSNKIFVLKPTDSRGSRGVARIKKNDNYSEIFNYSLSYSNNQVLILEEWIDGFQISSESIVENSNSYLCALADRNYDKLDEVYPYVVEDGGETPSKFSSKIENEVNKIMTKICTKLNLTKGSIKGDLIIKDGIIYVIEFATRLSGGYFSTKTIPEVYNYNLIENVIKQSLNESISLPEAPLKNYKFQKNRFIFSNSNGIIKNIKLSVPQGIKFMDIFVKEGDSICKTKNHTQRIGTILAIGNSENEVNQTIQKALDSIHIELY